MQLTHAHAAMMTIMMTPATHTLTTSSHQGTRRRLGGYEGGGVIRLNQKEITFRMSGCSVLKIS